jgi:cytochrome c oxidase subunit 1
MLDKLKMPERHYLNNGHGLKSWLLTKDHKRIAIMYLISISVMFLLGGLFAMGIRLELATPQGDFVNADTYNKFFTMHGVIMVFFFLIPSIPAVLGNFMIPPMIGAKDLAFPRINLLSLYIYWIGGIFTLAAMISGGVDTGWTFYTPYSASASNTHIVPTALGIFIAGFSSILTGLNFIVTIHRMRAPGMGWFRLPLFVWAHYATSLVQVLGTPVIAITIVMLGVERAFGFGIFDPARGGDPVLFQHLFWFYSHPAVYIMILPALGVMSELISTFSKKMIFGYSFVAFSSLAIAVFGFIVWAHHMFVAGISTYAAMVFSFLSFSVAIPGHAGHGHPPARHLLRGRALPLHHGRRRDHGLHGRPALLVAEDDRPHVFRVLLAHRGDPGVRRLQPDLPAAVRGRLPRHAAPLSLLPG